MKTLNWHHRLLMMVALVAVPVFANIGCSGFGVEGGGCAPGGCSGQVCTDVEEDSGLVTTCEYRQEYACYKQHSVCERNTDDQCGWRPSQELQDCITAARESEQARIPITSECIRNANDACSMDADCVAGGCGGELCHGVANMGASDCNCTAPVGISCGCVNGVCSWWQ